MSVMKILKLLGDNLLSNDGSIVPTDAICAKNEVIGLYYSSSSGPSSVSFTQVLIKLYFKLKSGEGNRRFEVVYISHDADEKQFAEFIKSVPWFSVPYADRERKVMLCKAFCVQDIPSLLLIDAKSGELITRRGRSCVLEDPDAIHFPWKVPNPIETLSELTLVGANGRKSEFKSLQPMIKGIYFSARWCPPCKAFTPLLIRLYNKLQKRGCKFEVIFVSSDLSEQSFQQYFSNMPWLAVPYEYEQQRKDLANFYGVGGIPSLIILDEDNSVITKDGRTEVNDDPDGEDFPWRPKLVDELSEKHVTKLNEEPCLILFTVASDEKELDAAHYLLLPVAEEFKARQQRASAEGTTIPQLNFFYAGDAEICASVRDVVQVKDHLPYAVILDMSNSKKYVLEIKKELNCDVLGKFMRDYLSSKLSAQPVEL